MIFLWSNLWLLEIEESDFVGSVDGDQVVFADVQTVNRIGDAYKHSPGITTVDVLLVLLVK